MTSKNTSNRAPALRKRGGEWFVGTRKAKEIVRKAVKDGLIIHPRKDENDEHKQDTKTGAHGKG